MALGLEERVLAPLAGIAVLARGAMHLGDLEQIRPQRDVDVGAGPLAERRHVEPLGQLADRPRQIVAPHVDLGEIAVDVEQGLAIAEREGRRDRPLEHARGLLEPAAAAHLLAERGQHARLGLLRCAATQLLLEQADRLIDELGRSHHASCPPRRSPPRAACARRCSPMRGHSASAACRNSAASVSSKLDSAGLRRGEQHARCVARAGAHEVHGGEVDLSARQLAGLRREHVQLLAARIGDRLVHDVVDDLVREGPLAAADDEQHALEVQLHERSVECGAGGAACSRSYSAASSDSGKRSPRIARARRAVAARLELIEPRAHQRGLVGLPRCEQTLGEQAQVQLEPQRRERGDPRQLGGQRRVRA